MKDEIRKQSVVQWLLWIALLLALFGSLRHVAHTFRSIDNNAIWGWIQAIAVDAGLFALALGITQRRRLKRSTGWIWLGIVLFSVISIYANLTYALTHTLDNTPTWVLDIKPYVLAGTLPILVLYLAEIVGSDVSFYVKEVQKEQRKKGKQTKTTEQPAGIEHAQAVRTEQTTIARDERQRQLVDILTEQPGIGTTALAEQLSVSRTTVYSDLDTLIEQGTIARNGQGYKLCETVETDA
jgi:biotin operon repressor